MVTDGASFKGEPSRPAADCLVTMLLLHAPCRSFSSSGFQLLIMISVCGLQLMALAVGTRVALAISEHTNLAVQAVPYARAGDTAWS